MGTVTRYGRVRAFPTIRHVIRMPSGVRVDRSGVTGLTLVWRGGLTLFACAATLTKPSRHLDNKYAARRLSR